MKLKTFFSSPKKNEKDDCIADRINLRMLEEVVVFNMKSIKLAKLLTETVPLVFISDNTSPISIDMEHGRLIERVKFIKQLNFIFTKEYIVFENIYKIHIRRLIFNFKSKELEDFLSCGIDPNGINNFPEPPYIVLALQCKNIEAIRLLISYGCKISPPNVKEIISLLFPK